MIKKIFFYSQTLLEPSCIKNSTCTCPQYSSINNCLQSNMQMHPYLDWAIAECFQKDYMCKQSIHNIKEEEPAIHVFRIMAHDPKHPSAKTTLMFPPNFITKNSHLRFGSQHLRNQLAGSQWASSHYFPMRFGQLAKFTFAPLIKIMFIKCLSLNCRILIEYKLIIK